MHYLILGLVILGLYGSGYLLDKTGEAVEQTSNSAIKAGIVFIALYYAYKRIKAA